MRTFIAGEFTAEVQGPYPMWIYLSHIHGEASIRFRHTELVDLKHVIERAIAEAERKCPGETK